MSHKIPDVIMPYNSIPKQKQTDNHTCDLYKRFVDSNHSNSYVCDHINLCINMWTMTHVPVQKIHDYERLMYYCEGGNNQEHIGPN